MPLICIILALLFAFTPPGVVKVLCIAYLLGYAGFMLYKRFQLVGTIVDDDSPE